MKRSTPSSLRPRVVVLTSRGESPSVNSHLEEVERMGVQCVRVTSANEATGAILGAQTVALLVDLRVTGCRDARVLQVARRMNLEVLAFGTLPPEGSCDDLSGIKFVAESDIPLAIGRVLDRSGMSNKIARTMDLRPGEVLSDVPPSNSMATAEQSDDVTRPLSPGERSKTEITERSRGEMPVGEQVELVGKQFRNQVSRYERVDGKPQKRSKRLEHDAGQQIGESGLGNEQVGPEIAEDEQSRRCLREVNKQLLEATAPEEQAILRLRRRIAELTGVTERAQREAAEHKQVELRQAKRIKESTATNEQLKREISKRDAKVERLEQQAVQLAVASERLRDRNRKLKRARSEFEQQRERLERCIKGREGELAAMDKKNQHELAKRKEAEELLEQRISELTGACERLEGEVSEHEGGRKELQEYRDALERRMKELADELAAVSKQLDREIAERRRAEELLREKDAELSAASEQNRDRDRQLERAKSEFEQQHERIEQRVRDREDELAAMDEQNQHELAKRKQTEELLRERITQLSSSREELEREISEDRRTQRHLELRVIELTTANEQSQHEIAERESEEEALKQRNAELDATSEQLRERISEYRQIEDQLKERRDQLERQLAGQNAKLAATEKRLRLEVSQRERAEEYLVRLWKNLGRMQSGLAEDELKEPRGQLERQLAGQNAKLAATEKRLRLEVSQHERAEEYLVRLWKKLGRMQSGLAEDGG